MGVWRDASCVQVSKRTRIGRHSVIIERLIFKALGAFMGRIHAATFTAAMATAESGALLSKFSNPALCGVTYDYIFTKPYVACVRACVRACGWVCTCVCGCARVCVRGASDVCRLPCFVLAVHTRQRLPPRLPPRSGGVLTGLLLA